MNLQVFQLQQLLQLLLVIVASIQATMSDSVTVNRTWILQILTIIQFSQHLKEALSFNIICETNSSAFQGLQFFFHF